MIIWTGYFGGMKNHDYPCPISIARFKPRWFNGPELKFLAPPEDILFALKDSIFPKKEDIENYIKGYTERVLGHLSPEEIYQRINDISEGFDCTLLCYEKTPAIFKSISDMKYSEFCHRHIISEFLVSAGFHSEEKYD